MAPAVPLTRWADGVLADLARTTGSAEIGRLRGVDLMTERAAANGWRVPGNRSAGGGCRLFDAADGMVALNLARADDRALMPALFGAEMPDCSDSAVAKCFRLKRAKTIVQRGRDMGLAIAAVDADLGASSSALYVAHDRPAHSQRAGRLRVVDLSALWAGPLAGHLLWLAGADVVKVESRQRPDSMRRSDPELFARLQQGQRSVCVDLTDSADRAALMLLLQSADVVIESTRPRALQQLGIVAEHLVQGRPGLVWLSITGHGTQGEAANWIGFGDDCGVAGGLSSLLWQEAAVQGFVGDAIADPLTGMFAALVAARALEEKRGGRFTVSMAGVVAAAIRSEQAADRSALGADLRRWAAARGGLFPAVPARRLAEVAACGADNDLLREAMQC